MTRVKPSTELAEARLRGLLSSLPGSAVFVVDRELRYIMAEGQALHAVGMAQADLLGKTVREVQGDEWADLYEAHYRSALEGGTFELEHEAHGRWFVTRGVPLRNVTGEVDGALAFSHDITERRQVEDRLRMALAVADLGTWEWDIATDALTWSPRTRALFGVSADEAIDLHTFETRLHPQDVERNRQLTAEALKTGDYANEFRVVHSDGSVHHVRGQARLLRDGSGRPLRMIGIAADVSAQRELEQGLRRHSQRDAYRVALDDALRPLDDPLALQRAATALLGRELGANRVVYVEPDGATLLVGPHHAQGVARLQTRYLATDYPTLTAEARAGRRVTMNDVQTTTLLPPEERDRVLDHAVRALMCVPVVKRGRLMAVVSVQFDRPRAWSEDDLWLLETTADRTWPAIERARAEQALAASQQRYRDYIQHSSEGIWRLDVDPPLDTAAPVADQIEALYAQGSFRECNEAMARMHGLASAEALLGQGLDATLPRNDPRSSAFLVALARAGWRLADAETQLRDAQGRERWFVHAIHGVLDNGSLLRLWGTQREITDRKAQEAALREADRRKDQFLAMLSHELRNPLAPVRTAARLLSAPGATAQQVQRAREVIERQTHHMSLLLDDLLDAARITQGKLVLKPELIALQEVVDAALESARPALDDKGHRLEVELPAEPVWLYADPVRLAQVLSNLLTNAAAYTPEGGRIGLRASVQGSLLELAVRDNGEGIAPEALDSIFSMFVQARSSSIAGRPPGGMGIGLAIVKGLVELHGGQVQASSAGLGEGSVFTVRLPLQPGASASMQEGGPTTGPAVQSRSRRILVADDNLDAADMLASLLMLQGHEVALASDGVKALEQAQTFRPDVALLDIGMPGLDGYEVAERLRKDIALPGLRLVALTGWGQASDRARALAAGFDVHFTKPVDLDALYRWIDAQ